MKNKYLAQSVQKLANRIGNSSQPGSQELKKQLLQIKGNITKGQHSDLGNLSKNLLDNFSKLKANPNTKVLREKLIRLNHDSRDLERRGK